MTSSEAGWPAAAPVSSPMVRQATLLGVAADRTWPVSERQVVVSLLTIAVCTWLARLLNDDDGLSVAVKAVTSMLAGAVVPGAVAVLLARPQHRLSLLELLGYSIAVSLSLAEFLTLISLTFHVSAAGAVVGTSVVGLLGIVWLWWRRVESSHIEVTVNDVILLPILCIIGATLYFVGSPVLAGEDLVHVSVIRRLATVATPALNNIFYAPDFVYTYPFPGTHFFLALASNLGHVDPLILYHKARFFWGPVAILFVYLCSRLIFSGPTVPLTTGVTCAVFVLNGSFADVTGFSWAQLAPQSHASDVAMNVLLPALVVLTLAFMRTDSARGSSLFFIATLGLVLMLTVVHIREVVQYVVYLGSFSLIALAWRRDLRRFAKSFALFGITVGFVLAYAAWHRYGVQHVDALVEARRALLVEHTAGLSWFDLVRSPFLDPYFSIGFETLFYGWFGIVVLASPVLVFAFRRHPFMIEIGMCILAYILIIRLPFLAIPYIYNTYFEILFTPVRNLVLFVYLLSGALLYGIALLVARTRSIGILIASLLTAIVALAIAWNASHAVYATLQAQGGRQWNPELDLFFAPVIGLYVGAFAWLLRNTQSLSAASTRRPHGRSWPWAFGCLLTGAALISLTPTSSPLFAGPPSNRTLSWSTPNTATFRQLLAQFSCAPIPEIGLPPGPLIDRFGAVPFAQPPDRRACAPNYELTAWVTDHVPVDGVFAIDTFNRYAPSPFMPQQIVAWPLADGTGADWDRLFPAYFEFFEQTVRQYHSQPVFNSVESLDERMTFARSVGVTHILTDPMYHDEMRLTLGQWPTAFPLLYDDGQWSVYGVVTDRRTATSGGRS